MQGFGHVEITGSPQKLPQNIQIQTVHPGQQLLEAEDLPHVGILVEIAGQLRQRLRGQRIRRAGPVRRFQTAGHPDASADFRLLFQLAAQAHGLRPAGKQIHSEQRDPLFPGKGLLAKGIQPRPAVSGQQTAQGHGGYIVGTKHRVHLSRIPCQPPGGLDQIAAVFIDLSIRALAQKRFLFYLIRRRGGMHREQRPPFRRANGENGRGLLIIRRGEPAANALRRHARDQAGNAPGRQPGQTAFQPAHGAAHQQRRLAGGFRLVRQQAQLPAPLACLLPDPGQIGLRPEIGPVGRFDQQPDHSFAPFQMIG